MNGKSRGQRQGSMIVVIIVSVIVGTLGIAAMTMSSSAARRTSFEARRENAFDAARAAAEEAVLMINNGKNNVEITKSMSEGSRKVELEKTLMSADTLSYLGIEDGSAPKVTVRASLISPEMLPRKSPREQLDAIQEEIEKRGYTGEYYNALNEFWNDRVENEQYHDKDGNPTEDPNNAFMGMTHAAKISSWGPLYSFKIDTEKDVDGNEVPVDPPSWSKTSKKIPELNAVWDLFYDHTDGTKEGFAITAADQVLGSGPVSKPSADQLKTTMDAAMEAVGKDAARRMDSCGSNPALAMSHLVGDLKTGQAIASGTEVAITSAFLKSNDFGAKTYLLEITSEMEYGKATGANKPKAEYTTYRVFQKSEWEEAITNMTNSLVAEVISLGMTPQQVADAWPRDPDVEGRDEEIPGHPGYRFDPKKVVADPVFKHLPSTVGATMYPYAIANAFTQDSQNKVETY